MKTSAEIIKENNNVHTPNAGIRALAKAAYNDPDGFCIMDDDSCLTTSYRSECLDRCSCHRADFMLACVSTRNEFDDKQMGEKAMRIYNEAMKGIEKII